jgi:hypothetical protein
MSKADEAWEKHADEMEFTDLDYPLAKRDFLAGYSACNKDAAEVAREQMEREEYGHAKHACGEIVDTIERLLE